MVVVQLLTVMNGYLLHNNNNRLRLKLIVQSPIKCYCLFIFCYFGSWILEIIFVYDTTIVPVFIYRTVIQLSYGDIYCFASCIHFLLFWVLNFGKFSICSFQEVKWTSQKFEYIFWKEQALFEKQQIHSEKEQGKTLTLTHPIIYWLLSVLFDDKFLT